MKEDGIKVIAIKPYTLKELAVIYGLHRETMRSWLQPFKDEIGERKGYYYQIPQVRIIFQKLMLPSYVTVKDEASHFG